MVYLIHKYYIIIIIIAQPKSQSHSSCCSSAAHTHSIAFANPCVSEQQCQPRSALCPSHSTKGTLRSRTSSILDMRSNNNNNQTSRRNTTKFNFNQKGSNLNKDKFNQKTLHFDQTKKWLSEKKKSYHGRRQAWRWWKQ